MVVRSRVRTDIGRGTVKADDTSQPAPTKCKARRLSSE